MGVSVPLKLKDSAGLQSIDSDNYDFLAYRAGLQLVGLDSEDVGGYGIRTGTLVRRTIGSVTDTSYDSATGTHGDDALFTTTSVISTLYQGTGTLEYTDSNYRNFVYHTDSALDSGSQSQLKAFTDNDWTTFNNEIVSRMVKKDYPGVIYLGDSDFDSANGSWSKLITNFYSDTRTSGDAVNYHIWQKQYLTDSVPSDSAKPFTMKYRADSAEVNISGKLLRIGEDSGKKTEFAYPPSSGIESYLGGDRVLLGFGASNVKDSIDPHLILSQEWLDKLFGQYRNVNYGKDNNDGFIADRKIRTDYLILRDKGNNADAHERSLRNPSVVWVVKGDSAGDDRMPRQSWFGIKGRVNLVDSARFGSLDATFAATDTVMQKHVESDGKFSFVWLFDSDTEVIPSRQDPFDGATKRTPAWYNSEFTVDSNGVSNYDSAPDAFFTAGRNIVTFGSSNGVPRADSATSEMLKRLEFNNRFQGDFTRLLHDSSFSDAIGADSDDEVYLILKNDFQGFQLADSDQLDETLNKRVRNYISDTTNFGSPPIGTYLLRSTGDGTPSQSGIEGTWESRGVATDFRNAIDEVNYTRTRTSTYARTRASSYSAVYSQSYDTVRTSSFTDGFLGNYLSDFTRVRASNFSRVRASTYTRTSQETYTGNYTGTVTAAATTAGGYAGTVTQTGTDGTTARTVVIGGGNASPNTPVSVSPAEQSGTMNLPGSGLYDGSNLAVYKNDQLLDDDWRSLNITQSGFEYWRIQVGDNAAPSGLDNIAGTAFSANRTTGTSVTILEAYAGNGNVTSQVSGRIQGWDSGQNGGSKGFTAAFWTSNNTWQSLSHVVFLTPAGQIWQFYRTNIGTSTERFGARSFGAFNITSQTAGTGWTNNAASINTSGIVSFPTQTKNVNYTRSSTADYVGNYSRNFAGDYTGNYTGNYTGEFTRTSTAFYSRDFTGNYTGQFARDFVGNYSRSFAGNFAGNFIGAYVGNYTRTSTAYSQYYALANIGQPARYWRVYQLGNFFRIRIRGYTVVNGGGSGDAESGDLSQADANATTIYVSGNTVYTSSSGLYGYDTLVRGPVRTGDGGSGTFYAIRQTINYTGNYSGNYGARTSTRTSTRTSSVTYTRTRASNYTRDFTRVRTSSYSASASFSRDFAGEYIGNYTGNYSRDFLGNYSRDFAGDYLGDTISTNKASTAHETYTLYVRTD